MRCLALAQAWQDAGGDAVFAIAETTPALVERLRGEQLPVVCFDISPGGNQDAARLVELAGSLEAGWLVVDGYHFRPDYQRRIKQAGFRLLFVDDNSEGGEFLADIVLNQNLHAREGFYVQRETYTRLLLGTRYAMLRREFAKWRGWKREIAPQARKMLVSMGGSDPDNLSGRVIEAVFSLRQPGLEARVIVGAGNPHAESLEQSAAKANGTIRLERSPQNIPELIAWADVAVSAAGSTCWELCFLGLPALVLDVAENQRGIARSLDVEGIAVHAGNKEIGVAEIARQIKALLRAPDHRAEMSQRGQVLVDGIGAQRVVAAMQQKDVRLRRAGESDCRLLWEWANEPAVRSVSFSSEPIAWPEHVRWFRERLADPDSLLYMALESESCLLGMVRFQLSGEQAVVSIVVAPEFRGQGYGKLVLGRARETLFASTGVGRIDAYVKPANEASLRMFGDAGFRKAGNVVIRGQEAVHFILERERPS